MFHKILVPLDGSQRAEHALPIAARIARASKATIVLVRIIFPTIAYEYTRYTSFPFVTSEMNREADDEELELATEYLKQQAASEDLKGLTIEMHTATNALVAEELLATANRSKADLIVMCSHGYTGLKRWALGSVATKLTMHCPVPVLILHNEENSATQIYASTPQTMHIMVTLDGSELSETALGPAMQLGAALSAPEPVALHLTEVLTLPTSHIPEMLRRYNTEKARARLKEDTQQYLEGIKQRLLTEEQVEPKPIVTTSVIVKEDVAATLVEAAQQGDAKDKSKEGTPHEHIDLIALTTHGRSGLQRWALGSIATRILETSRVPLFIVHTKKDDVQ
jgi:Universal stress protein UspA and related nucleotide-binding proteins